MTLAHIFDWHQEPEDSFLKWAMLTFAGFTSIGERKFDELSEATNRFENVELAITVNGIEVDAKAFMDRLDQAMDWAVKREAKKMIEEMPRLDALSQTLQDLEVRVREQIISIASEAGIDMSEDSFR